MPELPEVETVKESLKKVILNKQIKSVDVFYDGIIKNIDVNEFKISLVNETIVDIKRYGKYLLFILNNYILVSHLRMEGKYNYITENKKEYSKHEHVIFHFSDTETLRYDDTRKFGTMHLFKGTDVSILLKQEPLNKLGIEPLSAALTVEYLKDKFKKISKPIKSALLDQTIISGLGNIYADEVCFMSGINPYKKAKELSEDELDKIIISSKVVIQKAIKLGGTTIKSFTSSHMITGRFQNELLVHTKSKCPKCGAKIIKEFIGGRGTYYCKDCQK